jgi:DNA-binding response OmpR family regulator
VNERILVVEDDEAIATGLALNLKLAGRSTSIARDGDEAIRQAADEDFSLILLDINLPKKNGLEVLSALRLGADDYVTKPFALAELLARIVALLRRTAHVAPTPVAPAPVAELLSFDDVKIDTAQRSVVRDGQDIKLTHLEFELLVFFVTHPSQVFSRTQLFNLVWGQSAGSVRTVDNFVGQLRKRFEADPEEPAHFITVRGSGYRFDP